MTLCYNLHIIVMYKKGNEHKLNSTKRKLYGGNFLKLIE